MNHVQKISVERRTRNCSVTEDGKEGKSKMIASCGFLEDEMRQCSKEEGVRWQTACGNASSRFKTSRLSKSSE